MKAELEQQEQSLYPFVLTDEQEQLRREIRDLCGARDCAQRDEVGRGERVSSGYDRRSWARWGCWA